MLIWILAIIVVSALLVIMVFYLRRKTSSKGHVQESLPKDYQCTLFDEKEKREACQRLMNKGPDD